MVLKRIKRSDYVQKRKVKGLPIYLKKITTRRIEREEPEQGQQTLHS